jgi:CO/xanthine dehydrogenase Mo-binding subunit
MLRAEIVGRTASVARMERSEIRVSIDASRSLPDFAEPVIGPATSGRTRWLHPGYLLMPTDNQAKGIGEASLPLVAPCVDNALFKLTGKQFRAMPLSPERVKAVTGV